MSAGQASPLKLELEFSLVTEVAAPPDIDRRDLERLAVHVLREEGAGGHWDIAVALVDDARLQALHRDFMGIDDPTDIMTFPNGEPGEQPFGGELVISVDHATTQAGVWGLTPAEEIRFLVIHGLLHLLGWRDETDEERRGMLARQQRLLEAWRAS